MLFYINSLLFIIPLFSSLIISKLDSSRSNITIFKAFIQYLNLFSIILSSLSLYFFIKNGFVEVMDLSVWVDTLFVEIDFSFKFSALAHTMLWLVSIITTCVILYSMGYMKKDPQWPTFLQYIFMFQWFMYILVLSSNFFVLVVGWEGIGLCSYLLIGFWSTRLAARKAAMKAMLVNSIGDVSLFMAIAIITYCFQTVDFDIIAMLTEFLAATDIKYLNAINLLLIVAVTAKSSQIGLHIWLSDAMEGPTPVSALIHAATMVTAGIFLVIRCSFLFENDSNSLVILTLLGTLTAFIASTMALGQYDIKKIIAFSTCSQLGYMLSCCGLSAYTFGFFHLITHAFFKALLFLCAGVIIHSLGGEQDIRRMGGLRKWMPLTYMSMLIASLALMGFPYTSGFYSKDLIIEVAYGNTFFESNVMLILETLTAAITTFYSTRLLHFIFWTRPNMPRVKFNHLHEVSKDMAFPLILLSVFSIFSGYLLKDLFVGLGSDFFRDSIQIAPERFTQINAEFIWKFFNGFWVDVGNSVNVFNSKYIALIATFSGFFGAIAYYRYFDLNQQQLFSFNIFNKSDLKFKYIFDFLSNKWFFDKVYLKVLSFFIINTSYKVGISVWSSSINIIETMVTNFFTTKSLQLRSLHSGKLNNYIIYILTIQIILLTIINIF